MPDDERLPDALRLRCTRFLTGHGAQRPADLLTTISTDTEPDRYGEGGVVAELERVTAETLGKPAAVFLPSGTMAQQAVLRVHADRRGRDTVVFHPMCHLEQHELRGYQRLFGLVGRTAGEADRLLRLDDLTAVAEPQAALVLELPQRDLGGQQPAWDDLVAQVGWAGERGAATHLDGARLWESAAGYGRPPAEVAALFDTVYVSFYKALGGLAGCCLAGPDDDVSEVREWRKRLGGTLFALWPYAASALHGLRRRLPLMPRYLDHARAVAAAVAEVPGVRVVPDPPQTSLPHLLLPTSAAAFLAAARTLAEDDGVWTWPAARATFVPRVVRVELSVGDATCELSPQEIRDVVARLAGVG